MERDKEYAIDKHTCFYKCPHDRDCRPSNPWMYHIIAKRDGKVEHEDDRVY